MNDEMKGKSGKVKVMYVRSDDDSDKRTHNPRTGRGGGRPENLVLMVAVALPAMTNRVSTVTASGKIRRGARFRAPGDETPEKADHGGISGKSFIDPGSFASSACGRNSVSTAKTPVRHCSRAVRKRLFAPRFIQSVTPRFKEAWR